MLYVLEPTAEAHAMKGKRVRIYEDDDGNVSIRAGDTELAARAFPKQAQARVTAGDIVANKHLGAVLSMIRAQQRSDEERARKARTVRERRLLDQRMKKARGS